MTVEQIAQALDIHVEIVRAALYKLEKRGLVKIKTK